MFDLPIKVKNIELARYVYYYAVLSLEPTKALLEYRSNALRSP